MIVCLWCLVCQMPNICDGNTFIVFSLVRTMNYTELVLLVRSELPGKEMDYITDLQK